MGVNLSPPSPSPLVCFEKKKKTKDSPVRLNRAGRRALSACIAMCCDFDGLRVGCAQEPFTFVVRLPPLYAPLWCRYRPEVFLFGPAGTSSKHRLDVILPSLSAQWPSRRFRIPLPAYAVYHTPAPAASRGLSTIVAQPIKALHAFVNDAAEAGQDPDITKPWTRIWLRHRSAPYGG